MNNYICDVLKAVQSVPVKNNYIADYVAMRIFYILSQDSYLKTCLVNEVDIPEFIKSDNEIIKKGEINEI